MKIYFDGGCSPNPGKMKTCIVICRDGEKSEPHTILDLGQGTNNIAEWSGLVWAVTWLRENKIQKCEIIGDSKMVIMQAQGLWKIKKDTLRDYYNAFLKISQGMDLKLTHVLRDSNLAGICLEYGNLRC